MIKKIVELRHALHQHPEVSNNEYKTSERIVNFMSELTPTKTLSLSKTGKAFVFEGAELGKTIVFRAELDALPITEKSSLSYASINQNVSHACGHDGHMSILTGLAQKIANEPPKYGKVVILFQPAEEVEQGAKDVVEDPHFRALEPDYIFALHNIPGIEKHNIVMKSSSFSAAGTIKGHSLQN